MQDRNNITTIFRSNNPEKLIVFHASSLQHEIRFYINHEQYIVAQENNNTFSVNLQTNYIQENIKKTPKEIITIIIICTIFISAEFFILLYLSQILNNYLNFLAIIPFLCLMFETINTILISCSISNQSIKSKHSAEHMMVNFLEANKTLPKNIEEIKLYSRFSSKCGSRHLIETTAERFIHNMLAAILAIIINITLTFLSINYNIIIIFVIYYLTSFIFSKITIKFGIFNNIIRYIQTILNYIIQYFNTTSNVKTKDILLAYLAAKEWIQIVYPQFYNKENDIFWKQYFNVNNLDYCNNP